MTSHRKKLFISYAHEDLPFLEEFLPHIKTLQRDGNLTFHDALIQEGKQFDREIAQNVAEAKVAVLLVSVSFLTSDYIRSRELPLLQEAAEGDDRAELIPVFLSPCEPPPAILKLQAPRPNSPDRLMIEMGPPERMGVWNQLARRVREILPRPILAFVAESEAEAELAEPVLRWFEEQGLPVLRERWKPSAWSAEKPTDSERAWLRGSLDRNCSVLLFLGASGLGPWRHQFAQELLRSKVDQNLPVVAALLDPEGDTTALGDQLGNNHVIRVAGGESALERLYLALIGRRRPGTSSSSLGTVATSGGEALGLGTALEPGQEAERRRPQGSEDLVRDQIQLAVKDLEQFLAQYNLCVFLGPGATRAGDGLPPRPFELARDLLQGLKLPDAQTATLLPSLGVISSYYAVETSDRLLEHRIGGLIKERLGTAVDPPIHGRLADLFAALAKKKGPARRIIVTTNFDLLMERALLRRGVAFTRVVQHRSGGRIDINEYYEVEALNGSLKVKTRSGDQIVTDVVDWKDPQALDEAITGLGVRGPFRVDAQTEDGRRVNQLEMLPLDDYRSPILYKFHGSQDVHDSCAITVDQYYQFLRDVLTRKIVPRKIHQYLTDALFLFFGYGLLDDGFRVLYHTLLAEVPTASELESKEDRYAFQLPPEAEGFDDYRKLEQRLWPKIKERALQKFRLRVLDDDGTAFLEQLIQRLDHD